MIKLCEFRSEVSAKSVRTELWKRKCGCLLMKDWKSADSHDSRSVFTASPTLWTQQLFVFFPLPPFVCIFFHFMHPLTLHIPSNIIPPLLSLNHQPTVFPPSPLLRLPVSLFFYPVARVDFLVLCEGASEPPWAPAVLLLTSDILRAGSRSCLAALRTQWALTGALPTHTAGWPTTPGVSKVCVCVCGLCMTLSWLNHHNLSLNFSVILDAWIFHTL